jgi:hypothetical protein
MSEDDAKTPDQEPSASSPDTPAVRMQPSPNLMSVYSNSVQIRPALYDFHLDFGRILGLAEDGLHIETLVSVVMSPQHAKVLANLLSARVNDYERVYGPINTGAIGQPSDSQDEPGRLGPFEQLKAAIIEGLQERAHIEDESIRSPENDEASAAPNKPDRK